MSANKVNEEIQAQSGRFEFFKQTLTLGLAGIAGIAVFFTGGQKLPTDILSLAAVCVSAILLLITVAGALWGMSGYANVLVAHFEGRSPDKYRKNMLFLAQLVFLATLFAAISIVAYATIQVVGPKAPDMNWASSLELARKTVGATGCPSRLESAGSKQSEFVATYQSSACRMRFRITIDQVKGEVQNLANEELPGIPPSIVNPTACAPTPASTPAPVRTGNLRRHPTVARPAAACPAPSA